jgi:AcrR family transcriptional regulator
MTSTTAPRRRARRGEGAALRAEILTAARTLLAETGSDDAVSIRAVAERVGVSTPSIYLHFADKDALIDAVCESVFADLDAAMEQAAQTVPDPFEALKQRGLAYVLFALSNPEQYRIVLMSRAKRTDGATDVLAHAMYQHFVDGVRLCQEAGVFARDADPVAISTSLWAAAHGVAALLISHPGLVTEEQQLAMADQGISAAGLGLALLQRLPADPSAEPCEDIVGVLDAAFGPPSAG